MLNIPDSIKNLFKQDSTRKNFRVHFPNGEFRDLTNADIESETVSLTESINSSAIIKFGLCESPVMEFVCHGLPNVKGKTIQCQLEVDVTEYIENGEPVLTETISATHSFEVDKCSRYTVWTKGRWLIKQLVTFDAEHPIPAYITPISYDAENDISYGTVNITEEMEKRVNVILYNSIENPVTIHIDREFRDYTTSPDVEFPYYAIPYGVYKIKTCKRDGDTDKRTIVAYNKLAYYDWTIAEQETDKMTCRIYSNIQYEFDVAKFLSVTMNNTSELVDVEPILISGEDYDGYEPGNYNVSNQYVAHYDKAMWNSYYASGQSSSSIKYWGFTTEGKYLSITHDNTQEEQNGLYVTNTNIDWNAVERAITEIRSYSQEYFDLTEFKVDFAQIEDLIRLSAYPGQRIQYCVKFTGGGGYTPDKWVDTVHSDKLIFYPYNKNFYDVTHDSRYPNRYTVFIPQRFHLFIGRDSYGTQPFYHYTWDIASGASFNRFDFDSYKLSFSREFHKAGERTGGFENAAYYNATNVISQIDVKNMLESYIELQGKFGLFDRYGNFQLIDLTDKLQLYPSDTLYPSNDLYPREQRNLITRSMYSKVEYEDTPTRHYDKIECTWRDSNNQEHNQEYQIVDPASLDWYDPDDFQQYNLSDNYFIKNGYFTEEEVQTILETLGEKIKEFQYYPANIEMRGLPYLEAGDELAVVTRLSGFTTFILRRTMNGIQELKDNIEAEM